MSVKIPIINMKRFVLIICSILAMSFSYGIAQTKNQTTSEDTIKTFLTKMYNDKLYEDMDLTGEWAKAFVRNSYLYHWHKTQDVDSAVMAFCELAQYLMPDIKFDPSAIKAYIMSAEKENAMGDDLLNIVTAGKYYTPLCRCDIYPYMKEQVSEEALAAFYNVYDSWKTAFKTALKAIKDKCYREISLELYGNDHDIIGNREIVRYLIKAEK